MIKISEMSKKKYSNEQVLHGFLNAMQGTITLVVGRERGAGIVMFEDSPGTSTVLSAAKELLENKECELVSCLEDKVDVMTLVYKDPSKDIPTYVDIILHRDISTLSRDLEESDLANIWRVS